MRKVTLLEFRKNAQKVIRWARQGQRMVMTYRGKPVMRLEPIENDVADTDDPFFKLAGIAQGKKEQLSNKQMDKIIYGL